MKNKELVIQRAREWSAANTEKRAQINRRYRQTQWDSESVHSRIQVATPQWANMEAIAEIYEKCAAISTETGVPHHVDHIEPLRGADRCGLHVENNLRIIPARDNLTKGNSGIAPKRKEFLESLSEQEKLSYVKELFKECRSAGFPYYDVPSVETIRKSVVTARRYLIDNPSEELIATSHGNVVATAFFPHLYSVGMDGKISPEDVFFNDDLLMKALTRMIHRHDHVSDRTIRTAISIYGGARAVSNFPPMIAAKLYKKYAGDDAVVYDPCGGWGGRMLGAAIAPNVSQYVCTEVSELSVIGLQQLSQNLTPFVQSEVVECPAEDFDIGENSVDMVFTSPPYFNHERYSKDNNQSYLKFNNADAWLQGFLKRVIENAMRSLRYGGVLALNVSDVPSCSRLCSETMRLALEAGFVSEKTHDMFVQSTDGNRRKKSEPVFIFRKL